MPLASSETWTVACRVGYLVYLIVEMVIVEFLLQFLAQLIIAHCADRTAIESEL